VVRRQVASNYEIDDVVKLGQTSICRRRRSDDEDDDDDDDDVDGTGDHQRYSDFSGAASSRARSGHNHHCVVGY